MKVTIEYNLPEDIRELKRDLKSFDLIMVLWDIDQHLRGESKYHDNEQASEIRDELFRIMDQYGVVLDDLTE